MRVLPAKMTIDLEDDDQATTTTIATDRWPVDASILLLDEKYSMIQNSNEIIFKEMMYKLTHNYSYYSLISLCKDELVISFQSRTIPCSISSTSFHDDFFSCHFVIQ